MPIMLEKDGKLDTAAFEQCCQQSQTGTPNQIRQAQGALSELAESPLAWEVMNTVLNPNAPAASRQIGASILHFTVQRGWNGFQHKERVKQGALMTIWELSNTENSVASPSHPTNLLYKRLIDTIVSVAQHEFPHLWTDFVTQVVAEGNKSEGKCRAALDILKRFTEEVFEYALGSMTAKQRETMQDWMRTEFGQVHTMCMNILNSSQNIHLLKDTINALSVFLKWMPEHLKGGAKEFIQLMGSKFLPQPALRVATLECLGEVASENRVLSDDVVENILVGVVKYIHSEIPFLGAFDAFKDWANVEESGDIDSRSMYLLRLTSLLYAVLCYKFRMVIEARPEEVVIAIRFLLVATGLGGDYEGGDLFTTCLEFWNFFSNYCQVNRGSLIVAPVVEFDITQHTGAMTDEQLALYLATEEGQVALVGDKGEKGSKAVTAFQDQIEGLLQVLRQTLVFHMVKPEEVCIVRNDEGEWVKQVVEEAAGQEDYKVMRETLIYLTNLGPDAMESCFTGLLSEIPRQQPTAEHLERLSSICWAIGSISGSLPAQRESEFLQIVLAYLFDLCDTLKNNPNPRAAAQSNLLYVVGSYPRFLIAHWDMMKRVVGEILTFLKDASMPSVQDMAADTMVRLCRASASQFSVAQPGEDQPVLQLICENLGEIMKNLNQVQTPPFFEAMGYVLNKAGEKQFMELSPLLLGPLNAMFDGVLSRVGLGPNREGGQGEGNIEELAKPANIEPLVTVLKLNTHIARSLGTRYFTQLQRICPDLLAMYSAWSKAVVEGLKANPSDPSQRDAVVQTGMMCRGKVECLKLVRTLTLSTTEPDFVRALCIRQVVELTLKDYASCPPVHRDLSVLACLAVLYQKMGIAMCPQTNGVIHMALMPTLQVLGEDLNSNADHRKAFFLLLQPIIKHTFAEFWLSPHRDALLNVLLVGFKHTDLTIAQDAYHGFKELLSALSRYPTIAAQFYPNAWEQLVRDVMSLLFDTFHRTAFNLHVSILRMLLEAGLQTSGCVFGIRSPGGEEEQKISTTMAKIIQELNPTANMPQVESCSNSLVFGALAGLETTVKEMLTRLQSLQPAEVEELLHSERLEEERVRRKEARQAVMGLERNGGMQNEDELMTFISQMEIQSQP